MRTGLNVGVDLATSVARLLQARDSCVRGALSPTAIARGGPLN